MKISIYLLSFLIFFSLLISCLSFEGSANEEFDWEQTNEREDCEFVQIDENADGVIDSTEQAIMSSCYDNAFQTVAEIEENLIGEWELVGYGDWWGWFKSNPCSYIVIEKDELLYQFTDEKYDTLITFQWDIEKKENSLPGIIFFELVLEPEIWPRPEMRTFCKEYMYYDYTPLDGDMHLYEKVK